MDSADSVPTAQRRVAPKRKRENPNSRKPTPTNNAYSRRSPPCQTSRDTRPGDRGNPANDDSDGQSPPRKLKRPGGGSRVTAAAREAAEAARRAREEESRRSAAQRRVPGANIVAEHYNAVPERGRDWRQTKSKIAGLRSFNNWIKSTLIQKFSRPEIPVSNMKVLDLACGKGGDLGKWGKAPQVPVLYVGCDIANVSIEQAQARYQEDRGGHRRMQAEFYVHDSFGRPLTDIAIVRDVGFNPSAGPGGIIQGPALMGGFDVVSMMFALHYSFETEQLARGMLANVTGALKKGGRFIGVMPNSDVIASHIRSQAKSTPKGANTDPPAATDDWDPEKPSGQGVDADDDDWDPEKPADQVAEAEDDWDPEKPSEKDTGTPNGWDPEKPAETSDKAPPTKDIDDGEELTFGNDIYSVRMPKKLLPQDGTFRPPFGWKYHYHLEEAVEAPEYVVPWEAFRALAEDYGLELMYRKGFKEVFEDESADRELGELAYRMKVMSRNPREGLLVKANEMEAASFYHAFCFYKT